jgi:site-specific recombinase XerD
MRVIGKGNKERLVPTSPSVKEEISCYVSETRNHQSIKPGNEDVVFLNRRGAKLTRGDDFYDHKRFSYRNWLEKKCESAYL